MNDTDTPTDVQPIDTPTDDLKSEWDKFWEDWPWVAFAACFVCCWPLGTVLVLLSPKVSRTVKMFVGGFGVLLFLITLMAVVTADYSTVGQSTPPIKKPAPAKQEPRGKFGFPPKETEPEQLTDAQWSRRLIEMVKEDREKLEKAKQLNDPQAIEAAQKELDASMSLYEDNKERRDIKLIESMQRDWNATIKKQKEDDRKRFGTNKPDYR
jgi:hypothetical protein